MWSGKDPHPTHTTQLTRPADDVIGEIPVFKIDKIRFLRLENQALQFQYIYVINFKNEICLQQQTQNFCITFIQRRSNVFDVGPTLYKCYTNVLCLLGYGRCNLIFTNLSMFIIKRKKNETNK